MCCGLLGFWSFIGAIFYAISAVMVYNRNWVFITHKAGMDQFNATEEDFKQKMMQMIILAGVSTIKNTLTKPLDHARLYVGLLPRKLLLLEK